MKIPALLLGGLVVGPLLFFAQPLRAQSDGCALLKPADLATLLGGTPIAKAIATGCHWTVSGSSRKLIVQIIKTRSPTLTNEMVFAGARMSSAKRGTATVTDEAGIGDKAFFSLEPIGVVLMTLKRGRLIQMQYLTGAAGTAKDLAALRPVAKKAIAAF